MTDRDTPKVGDVWLDHDGDYVQVVSLPQLQGEGIEVLVYDLYWNEERYTEEWFEHSTSGDWLMELIDRQTEDVPKYSEWVHLGTVNLADLALGTRWYDTGEGGVYIAPVGTPEPETYIEAAPGQGGFITKDSGVRAAYDSGMVRDTQEGKARFELMFPKNVPYRAQLMTRFGELLERGLQKYGTRNWELANSQEEIDRFEGSAYRHLIQWLTGETDEDHASAVMFNLLAAETTKWKLRNENPSD